MRTAAWETAPQIGLRDCSKEAMGQDQYIIFWWKGSSVQSSTHSQKVFCYSWGADITIKGFCAFLDMKRCEVWGHEISSWKYLTKDLSTSFPGAQRASLSTLHSPQGVLKVGSCISTGFDLLRGRWQMPQAPTCSWQTNIIPVKCSLLVCPLKLWRRLISLGLEKFKGLPWWLRR